MESYEKIKKVLALGFMNFLDENKPKDKMCLSNGECADIEKAFDEKDWPKLARYLDKYTPSTLESEKPIEGLEEEIDRIVKCEKEFMNFQSRSQLIAYIARYFAKWGAEWQAKQDQETIELAEDHAYLAGAVNEREKIMKEAVDTVVSLDAGGFPFVEFGVGKFGLKVGNKVRVIVLPKEVRNEQI